MTRTRGTAVPLEAPGADADRREALFWVERERDMAGDVETARALNAWRAADPKHEAAYRATARVLALTDLIADDPRIVALRDEALAARPGGVPWARRAFPVIAGMAAAIAVGVGVTLFQNPVVTAPPAEPYGPAAMAQGDVSGDVGLYRTDLGERRQVVLPDGSTVMLNTATVIRSNFANGHRDIDVIAGQAYFDVAHDPDKPFRVQVGDRLVTALGTTFEVRLDEEKVSVLLVDGRVAVSRVAGRGSSRAPISVRPLLLEPGQLMIVRRGQAVAAVEAPDIDRATSWRQGRVSFSDEPLTTAVREINRYTAAPILMEDEPALARLKVSGVFRTDRAVSFLAAVESQMPVVVRRDANGQTVIGPAR